MIIELELKDEVMRLIEFIPTSMRSEILCDLIVQSIEARNSTIADEDAIKSNSSDINRMIKLMESIAAGEIKPAKTVDSNSKVETPKKSVEEKSIVVSLTGEDLNDFEDDEILDMLDIMK